LTRQARKQTQSDVLYLLASFLAESRRRRVCLSPRLCASARESLLTFAF